MGIETHGRARSFPFHSSLVLYSLLAVLSPGSPVSAYVRMQTPGGAPLRRTDFDSIQFLRNEGIAPGARNADGSVLITDQSDPVTALQAAVETWSTIPTSRIRFAPVQPTAVANDPDDRLHVISFAGDPDAESIVGDALAVTLVYYRGFGGQITDTDMIFSSEVSFSTTLEAGTFDFQSVLTHELGHALGANHSAVVGSAMYISTSLRSTAQSRLRHDDICFATDAYPAAGVDALFGRLEGRVSFPDGRGVRSAHITATNPATGVVVGTVSNTTDGWYSIGRIPPGRYVVQADPLNGPVEASDLGLDDGEVDTNFQTTIAGGFDAPEMKDVAAGGLAVSDITVTEGAPVLHLSGIGSSADGRAGSVPISLQPNRTYTVFLFGPGVDSSQIRIQLLGPELTLREGSIQDAGTLGGDPSVRFTVEVGASTGIGTILVAQGSDVASYSGGIVLSGPRPLFTRESLAHSAGFGGPGVAPGEIISIYGASLGPAEGRENRGLDPITGLLPGALAGTLVSFDGKNAPLFFVRGDQVNAQAPYEIAGRSETVVRVRNQDLFSDAVTVSVVESVPGIYTVPGGGQAIVLNPDNTINSSANPAPREGIIVIFATGAGVVDPPLDTGRAAPGSPLSNARSPSVLIDGQTVTPGFAGMAPGFAGLLQVNARIPAGSSTGPAVPLRIGVNGVLSPEGVTIAVR